MIHHSRLLLTSLVVCASTAFAQFELDLSAPADKPDKKAEPKKPAAPAKPAEKPAPTKPADDVGLDLSSTADVKPVLLLPPVVRVTQTQGGFSGFDTKKSFEKFDLASHKRFVASLSKQLEGKVLTAEVVQALITKEGFTVALSRTPAGLSKLAKAANAGLIVPLEFSKTGALVATITDAEGTVKGEPVSVANATSLSQKTADELAGPLAKALLDASKAKAAAVAVVEAPPPPPEEDVVDAPPLEVKEPVKSGWSPDPDKSRVTVAVGPGAALRQLSVGGDGASQLAELRNNGVVGVGVYAQVQPLQFIPSLAGKRWADLEVEVHFRHAFVRATGVEGAAQGTSCSMTDDDLQVRGTYRFKVAQATYAPWVGVGAGWSQERTLFDACSLPLVSPTYRGIDAQLRVKQPLFRNLLSLDLAAGPRVLQGDASTTTQLSLSGEAWLELKPASVFFVRGGARGSRLAAQRPDLTLAETRFFFALEAGAFF